MYVRALEQIAYSSLPMFEKYIATIFYKNH